MADEPERRRSIPWWRSPGAIVLWALIAAVIAVLFGDPLVEHVGKLLMEW